MSRAYRVRVSESERRTIRADDEVCTSLGMLDILPREEMAALLERELLARGYRKEGKLLRRDEKGVTITVDPATGEVAARAEAADEVKLQAQREGVTYDDLGPAERAVRRDLRERAKADLERQAEEERGKLQQQATGRLEQSLCDLGPELNQAVNRATAEALKRKAAQLGRIKDMHDDIASGSLTITVEV